LFFYEQDLTDINNDSLLLQFVYGISHLAAVLTILFIGFSYFFRKQIIDKLVIRFAPYNKVYIVKGNDENALCLGRDLVLCKQHTTPSNGRKGTNRRNIVIYWLEEEDKEKNLYEQAMKFGGIVKMMVDKNDLVKCLEDIGIIRNERRFIFNTVSGFMKLFWQVKDNNQCTFILMPNNVTVSDDVAFIVEIAKENKINEKLLQIQAITSSEWDKNKIESIINSKGHNKETKHFQPNIQIVDEIGLVTHKMIQALPPYKCFLDHEILDGRITRPFRVMVLGFGKTGQAALLRLVINGQFVGSGELYNTTPPMEVHIIDERAIILKEIFTRQYPSINTICCKLDFESCDIQSETFYQYLEQRPQIDYIVIATNNDTLNKETALDIRQYYLNLSAKMPFIAVISTPENSDGVRRLSEEDKAIKADDIYLFGSRKDIYNEEQIIREKVDDLAKIIYKEYPRHDGHLPTNWEILPWFTQENNRDLADVIDMMLYVVGYREQAINDIKERPEQIKDLLSVIDVDKRELIRETLGEMAHLHWNAFRAITGWTTLPLSECPSHDRKDIEESKSKRHAALVSWNEMVAVCEYFNYNYQDNDRQIMELILKVLKEYRKVNLETV